MSNRNKHIAIIGAGLVGSLLSIFLAKRGYKISVLERRSDMRKGLKDFGRSINLALSTRGLKALELVGLAEEMKKVAIPMHGRMVHDENGNTTLIPYGKTGQYINSISRSDLNVTLMNQAEKHGVSFYFDQRCVGVDFANTKVLIDEPNRSATKSLEFDFIIGADGAFSAIRSAMQLTDRFDYSQYYIEHGYKELHIPANATGGFQLEKNALHIWPRESFMLIALPNPDGSFTCTLFFPFEGATSFTSLKSNEEIEKFFNATFPDAARLMPDLLNDYRKNPTSSLVTVKCFPWKIQNTLVIGDAAHAIVPFYGQGMNAGFEDCSILNELLDTYKDDWTTVMLEFQHKRKPDADAIAQLALDNFVEMRDLVADEQFRLRKKIESKLHELYPEQWIPLYSMVTFNERIRYSDAYKTGLKQTEIMNEILRLPDITSTWQELNFKSIADRLTA